MSMTHERSGDLLAIASAFAGSLPTALLGAACWARFAPLDEQARFISALLLVIPAWVGSLCVLSVLRRPAAGLLACAILSAALGCSLCF
jgi:hypothetical protein